MPKCGGKQNFSFESFPEVIKKSMKTMASFASTEAAWTNNASVKGLGIIGHYALTWD